MVIKYHISSLSGNKEIKKRQMKAQLIMESKGVDFEIIDISDPGREAERKFMQTNAKPKDNARYPIAPQFFNEDDYCGDYDGFDEANETDTLEDFLKLPRGSLPQVPVKHHDVTGLGSRDISMEKEMFSSVPAQLIKPPVNGIESGNHKQDDDEHEEEEEDDKSKEEEEADEEDEVEETKEVIGDEKYVEKEIEDTRTKDEDELKNKIDDKNEEEGGGDDKNEEEEEDDDEEEEEEETLDDILQADDGEAEP